ncbi:hypothetical protein BCV71DRAFT_279023 [Rhizopus microsporus]|uniref:Uncharacterized protein n=1 Tax=Rhizopus microsporus TaxID=58291 RepID=A0A1X0RMA9_RHIZD|nr:hypothetical protein BCV71DRAFT_279023 [Rhizopus microsporus]
MTRNDRSCVLHWRFGWLPGGKRKPCLYHANVGFTHLQLSSTIEDSLSFILNQLPSKKARSLHSSSAWFVH